MSTPAKEYGWITAITPEEVKMLGVIQDGDQQWWDSTWHDMRGEYGGVHDPYYPVRRRIDVVKELRKHATEFQRAVEQQIIEIAGLQQELSTALEHSKWRPVSTGNLPKAGEGFLAIKLIGERGYTGLMLGCGVDNPKYWFEKNPYEYWLPLPPLPAPQKSEAEECLEDYRKNNTINGAEDSIMVEQVIKHALDWAKRKGK